MHDTVFIRLPVDGHAGRLHLLGVVPGAAKNIHVQVFGWT